MALSSLDKTGKHEAAPQPAHDAAHLSRSIWDDMASAASAVVKHEEKLFTDVTSGKATAGEYVEAGAQAVVATAAVGTALYFASPFLAAPGEGLMSDSGVAMALAPRALVPFIASNAGYDAGTSLALAMAPAGLRAFF